jgi:F0F1-type ATP synthase assembly protein I
MAGRKEANLGTLLGLGSTAVVLVIGGMAAGWFLDSRLGSFPLVALIGLALGIAAACWYTYREFRKLL